MENIIGTARSYLEERGIDTRNMTAEEIVEKYQELVANEPAEAENKPVAVETEKVEEIQAPNKDAENNEKLLIISDDDYEELTEMYKDQIIEMFKKMGII